MHPFSRYSGKKKKESLADKQRIYFVKTDLDSLVHETDGYYNIFFHPTNRQKCYFIYIDADNSGKRDIFGVLQMPYYADFLSL